MQEQIANGICVSQPRKALPAGCSPTRGTQTCLLKEQLCQQQSWGGARLIQISNCGLGRAKPGMKL